MTNDVLVADGENRLNRFLPGSEIEYEGFDYTLDPDGQCNYYQYRKETNEVLLVHAARSYEPGCNRKYVMEWRNFWGNSDLLQRGSGLTIRTDVDSLNEVHAIDLIYWRYKNGTYKRIVVQQVPSALDPSRQFSVSVDFGEQDKENALYFATLEELLEVNSDIGDDLRNYLATFNSIIRLFNTQYPFIESQLLENM